VLIDRGGHELPISADFVGKKLEVPKDQFIQVKLKETMAKKASSSSTKSD